jgi:hypothetical protein
VRSKRDLVVGLSLERCGGGLVFGGFAEGIRSVGLFGRVLAIVGGCAFKSSRVGDVLLGRRSVKALRLGPGRLIVLLVLAFPLEPGG